VSPDGQKILRHLNEVAATRTAQAADAALAERVRSVKSFQHARFAATYPDMLADARYGPAAKFFLDDLYGPHDFTERDGQFARIVPGLVRVFSADIVQTVAALAELHAISEELDLEMALRLLSPALDAQAYAAAWRALGRPADRERQIRLMLEVGQALDGFTRKPLLRHSLRLMRGPALATGLGALQRFLETGFDTFRAMRGAKPLLDTIAQRERGLAEHLFSSNDAGTGSA